MEYIRRGYRLHDTGIFLVAKYVATAAPITGDVAQLERWLNDEYQRVEACTNDIYALAEVVFSNVVAIGHGGVDLGTPVAFEVGAGYAVIPYDQEKLSNPVNVVQDAANNGLRFQAPGLWKVDILVNLTGHDEAQGGRVTNLEIYDATQGAEIEVVQIGIGRNVADTFVTVTAMFEVLDDVVNDLIQVRMGGGDVVSGGTLSIAEFTAFNLDAITGNDLEAARRQFNMRAR